MYKATCPFDISISHKKVGVGIYGKNDIDIKFPKKVNNPLQDEKLCLEFKENNDKFDNKYILILYIDLPDFSIEAAVFGYQLKAGQPAKSGNCAGRRKPVHSGAFAELGNLRTRTFVPA